jgi:glycosyltransferase involved in cell wall biosynthesis
VRILHVIDSLDVGGGAEHALALAIPRLSARGVRSSVACLRPFDGGLGDQLRRSQTEVHVLAGNSLVVQAAHLRRLVGDWQPDIVHASLHSSVLRSRLAGLGRRTRRLDSLVNTTYDPVRVEALDISRPKLRAFQAIDGLTARHLGDHFHVLSATIARETVDVLGVDPARVSVVPRGRDPSRLGARTGERRRRVRRLLGLPLDSPVVINVARQDPQKAQVDLIRAFASVRSFVPHVTLLIVGREGHSTPAIRETIAGLELESAVRLLGNRDDVPDLIAAADVHAFPSAYEGLGSAVIESLMIGTPVVVSDAPALVEVVQGGEYGTIVKRGDVEELAAAIELVLSDPTTAAEIASVAAQRCRDTYDLDRVSDTMLALYRMMIG